MRQPGFAGLQHFWMTPWFDRVRFGRWDEIVGVANPAPDLPYVTAIWNYAQAMAALRQGRTDAATGHHAALAKLAADPVMDTLMMWDRYPLSHATRIAERTVAAELALARKDTATAIAALREAVAIEDTIPYDEPPGWHAPVRQSLGVALLAGGRCGRGGSGLSRGVAPQPGQRLVADRSRAEPHGTGQEGRGGAGRGAAGGGDGAR